MPAPLRASSRRFRRWLSSWRQWFVDPLVQLQELIAASAPSAIRPKVVLELLRLERRLLPAHLLHVNTEPFGNVPDDTVHLYSLGYIESDGEFPTITVEWGDKTSSEAFLDQVQFNPGPVEFPYSANIFAYHDYDEITLNSLINLEEAYSITVSDGGVQEYTNEDAVGVFEGQHVTIQPATVYEKHTFGSEFTTIKALITLDNPSTRPIQVTYKTVDNSAKANSFPHFDYLPVEDTVTIPVGEESWYTDRIYVRNDLVDDVGNEESFQLVVTKIAQADEDTEELPAGTVTIIDAETATAFFSSRNYRGWEADGVINAWVILNPASENTVTVEYQTYDNGKSPQATVSTDYASTNETITINPRERFKKAPVTIYLDGDNNEPVEFFGVQLNYADPGLLGNRDTATMGIWNDKQAKTLIAWELIYGFNGGIAAGSAGLSSGWVTVGGGGGGFGGNIAGFGAGAGGYGSAGGVVGSSWPGGLSPDAQGKILDVLGADAGMAYIDSLNAWTSLVGPIPFWQQPGFAGLWPDDTNPEGVPPRDEEEPEEDSGFTVVLEDGTVIYVVDAIACQLEGFCAVGETDAAGSATMSVNPAATFNSKTVDKPKVYITIAADEDGNLPALVEYAFTFDGSTGDPVSVDLTGIDPDENMVLLAVEADHVPEESGFYDWSLDLDLYHDADTTTPQEENMAGSIGVAVRNGSHFGNGWGIESVDELVYDGAEGRVLMITGSGESYVYTDEDAGAFTSPPTDAGVLYHNKDGSFTHIAPDQMTREFDDEGHLLSVTDRHGLAVTYDYDDDLLTTITEPGGRLTTFTYDKYDRLDTIEQNGKRYTTFTYSGDDDVASITQTDGGTRYFTYDSLNRIKTETWGDRLTTLTYDSVTGGLSQIEWGEGSVTKYNTAIGAGLALIDTDGHIRASLTDPMGVTTNVELDNMFRVVEWATDDGAVHQLSWDDFGPTTYTDPLERTTSFTYDGADLVGVEWPDQSTWSFDYDDEYHQLEKFTDSRKGETVFQLNEYGDAKTITDAEGHVTTVTWDTLDVGLVQSRTDPRGNTTSYEYDEQRRLAVKTDAEGGLTTYHYDAAWNLDRITDPDNRTVTRTFDGMRRVTSIERPGDMDVSYKFDNPSRVTQVTDPEGTVTTFKYDARGLLSKMTEAVGTGLARETVYARDFNGRVTAVTRGGATATYSYDRLGRMESWTNPSFATGYAAYELDGRLATVTDALGHTTSFSYHAERGWLTGVEDPTGAETAFTYDTEGNLLTSVDAEGVTTSLQYDKLNRVIRIDEAWGDPEVRVTQFAYDKVGNLSKQTDTFGTITSFGYDNVNRLTNVVEAHSDATQRETVLTYSKAGDQTSATVKTSGGTLTVTSFAYDAANRKSTVARAATTGIAQATVTQFNKRGQVVSETDPFGVGTSYTYDALGRTTKVVEAGNTGLARTTTMEYDVRDRVVRVLEPLDVVTSYVYTDANQVKTLIEAAGSGVERQTEIYLDAGGRLSFSMDYRGTITSFAYDEVGRPLTITEGWGDAAVERTTTFAYDKLGRTVSVTDPLLTETTYSYDGLSRLTGATEAVGWGALERTTSYKYGTAHNTLTIVDPRGNWTTINHDALGRVETVKDALNNVTTYAYDALDRTTQVTNARKNSTSYQYDALSRLTNVTDADSKVTSFAFSTTGSGPYRQRVTMTNPRAYDTVTDFDELGRAFQVTDALSGLTSFVYDAQDRVVAVADPLNHRTTYGYDELSRVTTITNARSKTTTIDYMDSTGIVVVTDPNDHATLSIIDALGRTVAVVNALFEQNLYVYDQLDRVVNFFDGRENQGTLVYDVHSRLTSKTDGAGHTTQYGYDLNDNLTTTTDALNNVTTYTFDELNRMTRIEDPLHDLTTFGYDEVGNLAKTVQYTTSTGLMTTAYEYDALDRLVRRIDDDSGVTSFVYDANGNMTELHDPVVTLGTLAYHNVTTFTYDELDRKTKMTDPVGHSATYHYDAAGRLDSETDRSSRRIDYTYNEVNQLTGSKWYAVNDDLVESNTFAYDDAGNLKLAANSAGTYTLSYDELNRVERVDEPFNLVLTFSYDASGNRTKVEDSRGGVVSSVYDKANRLERREWYTSSTLRAAMDYAYTDADQLLSVTRNDDDSQVGRTTFSYDAAGNMHTLRHQDSKDTTFQTITYTYDEANRLTETLRNSTSTTYQYDDLHQLTRDGTVTFGYDAAGNSTIGPNGTMTYGQANRIESWKASKSIYYVYEHDEDGNRIVRQLDLQEGYTKYAFDHANRLAYAQFEFDAESVQWRVDYTYDAFGNRIARLETESGTTTISYERYGIDMWEVEQDFWGKTPQTVGNENANVWVDLDATNSDALMYRRLYSPGFDQVAARLDGGNTTRWYLTDRQGSVVGVTDASGAPLATITYEAFGATKSGSLIDRYGYTGREWDSTLSLYHYRDRAYDPATRRFLQEDPIELRGGDYNFYRYVGNSPTNAVDPSGRAEVLESGWWGELTVSGSWLYFAFGRPTGNDLPRYVGNIVMIDGIAYLQNGRYIVQLSVVQEEAKKNLGKIGPINWSSFVAEKGIKGTIRDGKFYAERQGELVCEENMLGERSIAAGDRQGVLGNTPNQALRNLPGTLKDASGHVVTNAILVGNVFLPGPDDVAFLAFLAGVDKLYRFRKSGKTIKLLRGAEEVGEAEAKQLVETFAAAQKRAQPIAKLTTKEARKVAQARGWSEVKDPPFASHGQKVFTDGNKFYTVDADCHSGGVWKQFDRKGRRLGTLDGELNRIGN